MTTLSGLLRAALVGLVWIPGSVSAPNDWVVGLGPGCYGIWTETWAKKQGAIPTAVMHRLVRDYNESVLEHLYNKTCPYGRALPGQVTWPHSGTEFVAGMTYVRFVAVVYSYVPYMLGAYVVLDTIWSVIEKRGRISTSRLYVLLWLAQALLLQECLIKPLVQSPRPGTLMQLRDYDGKLVGSCSESCGMPSSHSMLAMGWITILLFDRIYRVNQFTISSPVDVNCRAQCKHELVSFGRFLLSLNFRPWWHSHLTHQQFMGHLALWTVLLAPVPWMRVLLHDHTMDQAIVGSVIGILDALLWWRLARVLQCRYKEYEGKYLPRCSRILHDFKLPHVPDSVTEFTIRAAANLAGEWVLQDPRDSSASSAQPRRAISLPAPAVTTTWGLSSWSAGGVFTIEEAGVPNYLRVLRYPGLYSSAELVIYHVDMKTAFISFKDKYGRFDISATGVASQVTFDDGSTWLRLSQDAEADGDDGISMQPSSDNNSLSGVQDDAQHRLPLVGQSHDLPRADDSSTRSQTF